MELPIALFFIATTTILVTLVAIQRRKETIICVKSKVNNKLSKINRSNRKMK